MSTTVDEEAVRAMARAGAEKLWRRMAETAWQRKLEPPMIPRRMEGGGASQAKAG